MILRQNFFLISKFIKKVIKFSKKKIKNSKKLKYSKTLNFLKNSKIFKNFKVFFHKNFKKKIQKFGKKSTLKLLKTVKIR